MAILKIQELKTTIKGKGIVKAVDDAGVLVVDEKSGETDIFTLDVFKEFINKEITFNIRESKKQEEDLDNENYEEAVDVDNEG